jgi:hypothetical protein
LFSLLRIIRFDIARARFARVSLRDEALSAHFLAQARAALQLFRAGYDAAPASTRRRWGCGR